MKHNKLRQELLLATIFSLVYLTLSIFHYHLDNLLQGIPIGILTIVFFLILSAMFVMYFLKILRRRKKSKGRVKLRFIFYLPTIILGVALLYTFSPFKLDSERLESKVVLRGCFDGGSNRANIRFRENKNFEIKWRGESGYNERFFGNYRVSRDTFFLTYFENLPDKFGSIVLNTGQTLVCLDRSLERENSYISFYLGSCGAAK